MADSEQMLEQVNLDTQAGALEDKWGARGEQLREQEWDVAQKLIRTATILLERLRKRPNHEATLAEITRMLDVASRLGRLATNLQTDKTETTGHVDVSFRVELEAALKKVYGPPAGPVIDVNSTPAAQ